ncbi:filamentous hemagglutinin N-terminal domain-containing protein [Hylemonella gracilis]|uniref:Filamentous hemagglutinin N-terminal domain-containing protein n=2 Tax=Hylemonella gracilis TaxID=80880 RepID=A0A4P6UQ55_9BURK|nr:filamentous hemagglutinin N-terminal domain-containing protein [Hylemonella gracilis]
MKAAMSKVQRLNRSLGSGSTSPGFSDRVTLTRITPIALAAALALGGGALPLPLYAGPKGGTVVGGSGSVSQPDANTTQVQQNSHRLAVQWDSFNVGADERVNFYQPSSSAWVLNQILDSNASVIRGQINANGNVILVNGNGVYFSSTAQLSVGSLVASGLGLSTESFMAGQLKFERQAGTSGRVVNRGVIQAATGAA